MVQGVAVEDGAIVDRNPANGEVISRVPCTELAAIPGIVEAARVAQTGWARLPLLQRVSLLKAACAGLKGNEAELAATITAEMGKVTTEAVDEAQGAADKDEMLTLIEEANRPEVVGDAAQSLIVRDPLGVVVVLAPWNFPADEILLLALPALAAGNSVIVKPSEVAPLTGALVVQALAAVLPQDVVQICQGDGAVGAALVNSNIDMVAMTGSSATGKKIMAACAPDLKRLVLELGGKDPMVVFADADLEKAAHDAVFFSLFNCGQVCCSVERVYVEESIMEPFEARVRELAAEYTVGPGTDPASKVGPMVSVMQKQIVEQQVNAALDDGAKLVFRSDVPEGEHFYPVTVLSGVRQDMRIQCNETFGPVVCLASFSGSEDDAVALANDTEYGLAAYCYTQDLTGKGARVASGIKAGQVGLNCYSLFNANAKCPWVGAKGSGFGYHSGFDGWRQFSVPKSIVFDTPAPAGMASHL